MTSAQSPCLMRRTAGGDTAGSVATIEVGPVGRGPAGPPAAARHALAQAPLEPPALRVVTYNILADQYASTDHAQNVLFGYCPTQCAPKACSSLPLHRRACDVLPLSRRSVSGVEGINNMFTVLSLVFSKVLLCWHCAAPATRA